VGWELEEKEEREESETELVIFQSERRGARAEGQKGWAWPYIFSAKGDRRDLLRVLPSKRRVQKL